MKHRLFAAAMAAILTLLVFASCAPADPDTPSGMRKVADGENGYVVYIPTVWTAVEQLGGLYAYVSQANTTGVVLTYTDGETLSPRDAYARDKAVMATSLSEFTEVSTDGNILVGDRTGFYAAYTYKIADKTLRSAAYYTLVGDRLYLLTYTEVSTGDSFSETEKDAANIVKYIRFTDHRRGGEGEAPFPDDATPAGMKRASNPAHTGYKLFVPESYVIHTAKESTLVSVSESDMTSVHAYVTVPNVAKLEDYLTDYKSAKLPILYKSLAFLDEGSEATVGGVTWTRLEYTGSYGGVDYKVEQYFIKSEYYVLSLTYTARAEKFDTHRASFGEILDAFTFGE